MNPTRRDLLSAWISSRVEAEGVWVQRTAAELKALLERGGSRAAIYTYALRRHLQARLAALRPEVKRAALLLLVASLRVLRAVAAITLSAPRHRGPRPLLSHVVW
jgi:hypothetical protein